MLAALSFEVAICASFKLLRAAFLRFLEKAAVFLFFKMVKLTAELIQSSMQYINPVKDRELDLRGKYRCLSYYFEVMFGFLSGYRIPEIENLGATGDQFDTIDFSDNDVRKLDGFPYLKRLKCLLLNNNRIV